MTLEQRNAKAMQQTIKAQNEKLEQFNVKINAAMQAIEGLTAALQVLQDERAERLKAAYTGGASG